MFLPGDDALWWLLGAAGAVAVAAVICYWAGRRDERSLEPPPAAAGEADLLAGAVAAGLADDEWADELAVMPREVPPHDPPGPAGQPGKDTGERAGLAGRGSLRLSGVAGPGAEAERVEAWVRWYVEDTRAQGDTLARRWAELRNAA